MQSLDALKVTNHLKQIAGLRIAARAQHAHEALRRALRPTTQLLEPDRRVDVVAKNPLSGLELAREKTLDAFSEGSLLYFRSARMRACSVSLNSRVRGISFSCVLRFL
jgi:hypothetical protein